MTKPTPEPQPSSSSPLSLAATGSWNSSPVISVGTFSASALSIYTGQRVELNLPASDRDTYSPGEAPESPVDRLWWHWKATGGSLNQTEVGTEGASTALWTAPPTPGTYIISCQVNDSKKDKDKWTSSEILDGRASEHPRNDSPVLKTITIQVTAAPPPTPTPLPTATPAPTPTAAPTAAPTATPLPPASNGYRAEPDIVADPFISHLQGGSLFNRVVYIQGGQSVKMSVTGASDLDDFYENGVKVRSDADALKFSWSSDGAGGSFTSYWPSDSITWWQTPRVSETTLFTLTCEIDDLNDPANEARNDAPITRTFQVQVRPVPVAPTPVPTATPTPLPGVSWSLDVLRKIKSQTSTGADQYDRFPSSVGGQAYGALYVTCMRFAKVSSSSTRLRLRELPDALNGVAHGEEENHVDVPVNFSNANGWQKLFDPDGNGPQKSGWWPSREAPTSAATATSEARYRYLFLWNTMKEWKAKRFDGGEEKDGKLLGHNGAHLLSVGWVDDVEGAPLETVSTLRGSSQVSAPQTRTVIVSNLAIENISTSTGNAEWFKFDPLAPVGSALRNPTISFSIRDDGNPHVYRVRVRARSTDVNDDTELSKSTVYEKIMDKPGPVKVVINKDRIGAEGGFKPKVEDWGTFAVQIQVLEYANKAQAEADIALGRGKGSKGIVLNNKIDSAYNLSEHLFIPYKVPIEEARGGGFPGHMGSLINRPSLGDPYWRLSHYL